MNNVAQIFTDAGVLSAGHSPHGGPFAYRFVDHDGTVLHEHSAIITPRELGVGTIEINCIETYAILVALEAVDAGWQGELLCDNLNAKRRFTEPTLWGGVPDQMRERCHAAVKRAGRFRATLLAGHPSLEDLMAGFKTRPSGNPYPVSIHNVACDQLCKQQAKLWRQAQKQPKVAPTPDPPVKPFHGLITSSTPDHLWPGTPAVK